MRLAIAAALLLSCTYDPKTPTYMGLTVPIDLGGCGATWVGVDQLLTAGHCVGHGAVTVWVDQKPYPARVVRRGPVRDLALLHSDVRHESWATVGVPIAGQKVYVTTAQQELIRSRITWVDPYLHFGAQLDFPCQPGDSGSAVWSEASGTGVVVCVVVSCGQQRARCEIPWEPDGQ
jgi:hypothetical protein